jgi:hypothetical protein
MSKLARIIERDFQLHANKSKNNEEKQKQIINEIMTKYNGKVKKRSLYDNLVKKIRSNFVVSEYRSDDNSLVFSFTGHEKNHYILEYSDEGFDSNYNEIGEITLFEENMDDMMEIFMDEDDVLSEVEEEEMVEEINRQKNNRKNKEDDFFDEDWDSIDWDKVDDDDRY